MDQRLRPQLLSVPGVAAIDISGGLVREIQVATHEHMKVAFHQYKDLKTRFETPERATKEFLARHRPSRAP